MRLQISIILDNSIVLEDRLSGQNSENESYGEAENHTVLVGAAWTMYYHNQMREEQDEDQITEEEEVYVTSRLGNFTFRSRSDYTF